MILTVCPNPSIDTYAWLESLSEGESNRITKLKEYPGGKATHISMALSQLGQHNTLFGNWAGSTGSWIKQQCSLKGVRTAGIQLDGQNRKCYTFRAHNKNFNNTELLEPGPKFNKKDWALFKSELSKQVSHHDIICIAGSWPKGAPENAYATVMDIAQYQQKSIIVDCSGKQLKNILEKSFFGIHLNEDEASSLLKDASIEEIITKLSSRIELIAITKGKEGLWLYYQNQLVHANVAIENVISTVGSGDCLTAGIAYALNNNMNIEDIARYGVACGAANCLNEELGILKANDVKKLLPKVKVKTINELKEINHAK